MSISDRIDALEKKHEALEWQIKEAIAHPSVDDLTIVDLKRKKLQIKDEITSLLAQHTAEQRSHLPAREHRAA